MPPSVALEFRAAVPRDLPTIAPWLRAAGLGPPADADGAAWERRLSEDPRIVCVVGEAADGRCTGFFRLDVAPDRTAEVTLVVAPDRRRRGYGRLLLERALAEARRRGLRRLDALVQPSNRVALAFFDDAGFESTDRSVPGFVPLARVVHRGEQLPPLEIAP